MKTTLVITFPVPSSLEPGQLATQLATDHLRGQGEIQPVHQLGLVGGGQLHVHPPHHAGQLEVQGNENLMEGDQLRTETCQDIQLVLQHSPELNLLHQGEEQGQGVAIGQFSLKLVRGGNAPWAGWASPPPRIPSGQYSAPPPSLCAPSKCRPGRGTPPCSPPPSPPAC